MTYFHCGVIIKIDNYSLKGAAHILKIILWLLLALLALLLLLLLLSVKILVGYGESFYWRLTVGGIPIKPEWFMGKDKKEKEAKKKSHKAKKKKSKKKEEAKTEQPSEKEKSPGEGLSLVLELARKAAQTVPRTFRIRLKKLCVTVGGSDAADIATEYGKIYALIEGALAVLDAYQGVLYGFRANRRRISITADFLAVKTTVRAELAISFFVWQLLFTAVRIGVVYILRTVQGKGNS